MPLDQSVLKKPQLETCADGAEHRWMVVADEVGGEVSLQHLWCDKCGSLTQVGAAADGARQVAVNEDGQPHLAVPVLLNGEAD